jgi:signal transduction histidine kinase
MTDTLVVMLIAASCAATAGVLGGLVLRVHPRPSLRTTLTVATVATVLAVVSGVVGTAEAMFISPHDLNVVLVVCVVAGAVASVFGLLLAGRVVADSRRVRGMAAALADEQPLGAPAPTRTAELADVSRELQATSQRLARARERERTLEASRRELVAWVSHDLRTPLAGLRAMAEALEDGVVDDPHRYHKQIRVEVQRLAGMVNDLFELSRLHAGTMSAASAPVALVDLVGDALAAVDPLARERRVSLTHDCPFPLTVAGDERELSRALSNLMVNAVTHTRAGGAVRVTTSARQHAALVSVLDECGGIPEDDLPKVFDVAWRGTHERTPGANEGAGLGLAIVRGIVEAHHGQVAVVNSGSGCRFDLRLPTLNGEPMRHTPA